MAKCPKCKATVAAADLICQCGFDFTMDDCPGCDERIPEGTLFCPHCNYDILEGIPAKIQVKVKSADKKIVVKEDREPELRRANVPSGLRTSHVVAPGSHGKPDPSYPELLWPKDREVNDNTLLEWAESFREAYTSKVRPDCLLSNRAIHNWCQYTAVWHAQREGKEGRNDILQIHANRILSLLGGNDYNG